VELAGDKLNRQTPAECLVFRGRLGLGQQDANQPLGSVVFDIAADSRFERAVVYDEVDDVPYRPRSPSHRLLCESCHVVDRGLSRRVVNVMHSKHSCCGVARSTEDGAAGNDVDRREG